MQNRLAQSRKRHHQHENQRTENDGDRREDGQRDVVHHLRILPQRRRRLRRSWRDDLQNQNENSGHSHSLHRVPECASGVPRQQPGAHGHADAEDDDDVEVAEGGAALRLQDAGAEGEAERIVERIHRVVEPLAGSAARQLQRGLKSSAGNRNERRAAGDGRDRRERLDRLQRGNWIGFRFLNRLCFCEPARFRSEERRTRRS